MKKNFKQIEKELTNYYEDLLIVQYHDKPKARGVVRANIEQTMCALLDQKIKEGFDLDTAVGKQLDIIGKWVGIDRFYKGQRYDNRPWFSLPKYGQKTNQFQGGFSRFSNFANLFGGILTYDYIIGTKNKIKDSDYRTLIKLKIIRNNVAHSPKPIDNAIYKLFKGVTTSWDKVYNDNTGYNNLLSAKHSTFDKSKFEVVGTPTITDDGIASGFSGSNYINMYQFDTNKNWEIDLSFTLTELNIQQSLIGGFDGSHPSLALDVAGATNKLALSIGDGTSWQQSNMLGKTVFEIGKKYFIKLIFNKDKGFYRLLSSTDNLNFVEEKEYASSTSIGTGVLKLGVNRGNGTGWKGTIDLKQFSITVDDKEVFNGNKTGIDIIKPDNFTKVGNPVISDDGIASGFDGAKYVSSKALLLGNNFKILANVLFNSFNKDGHILRFTNPNGLFSGSFYLNNSSKTFTLSLKGKNGDILPNTDTSYKLESRVEYVLELIKEGDSYSFLIKKATEQNFTTLKTISSTDKLLTYGNFVCGINPSHADTTIDLNAFKIYVDGNLVYQPCLKIPYTESKTGSKIVDNYYNDRLIDTYAYKDWVDYYTINEENKTYTNATNITNILTKWHNCMEMTYYYKPKNYSIIKLGKEKNCFPIPTGVKANFVEVK